MTLTLLLQLTDEEQLYAQAPPEPAPVSTEAPVPQVEEGLKVEVTAEEVG